MKDGADQQGETRDRSADRSPTSRNQARAYQGAFEAVFAVLIAAGIGFLADRHYGTEPRYLMIGVGIGFGSFVLRLVRLGSGLHDPGSRKSDGES
ncbi:MAG: hypothetical protein VCB99_02890 [Myxococcota bacterium]